MKAYANPRVGFSMTARFTPTYIKTDPEGGLVLTVVGVRMLRGGRRSILEPVRDFWRVEPAVLKLRVDIGGDSS